jgi:hypothetical protein
MPYASKESKAAHNRSYGSQRKVPLMIARMKRLNQSRITQRAYDTIKDEADPVWLATLKVIKSKADEQQPARRGRVKISPNRVKELIDSNDKYSAGTKKTYKSKVDTLVRLLCANGRDFTCMYTKINQKIDTLNKEYKDPSTYLRFMAAMVDEFEEIRQHIPKQNVGILNRRKKQAETTQQAKAIENNESRDAETDWKRSYNSMVLHPAATDELKALKTLYIQGIYDDKGELAMIPRNYFVKTKVVRRMSDTNKIDNFYLKSTGTVILNTYKTASQYGPIKYRVPKNVRIVLNRHAGDSEYLFGDVDVSTMNRKIKDALGVGIDDYRRIMKRKHADKYSVEQIAKAMAHAPTTGKVSY